MKTGPKPQVIRRTVKDHPAPSPQPTFCRLWQGTLRDGYGIRRFEGHKITMPRWVLLQAGEDQFGTPWNPELYALHLCDQPLCYRYEHLMLGTHRDNVRQAVLRGLASQTSLTVEQVQEVRALYSTGEWTHQRLADRFGLSVSAVGHLVRRYSWKDVP